MGGPILVALQIENVYAVTRMRTWNHASGRPTNVDAHLARALGFVLINFLARQKIAPAPRSAKISAGHTSRKKVLSSRRTRLG